MLHGLALVLALIGPELWDSGKGSSEPLSLAALEARAGWTKVADPGAIKGDAVLLNGKLTAVIRRAGSVELYSPVASRAALRFRAKSFDRLSATEVSKGAVAVRIGDGVTLRLKKGDPSLEAEPGAAADALRLDCPGRFTVFPDFFADDVVIDARQMPAGTIEAPSDNFLLHLTGDGDAIAMAVFENREQDVKLTVAGEGAAKTTTGSEIEFGKKHKIWVTILEGRQIWHAVDLAKQQKGRIVPLAWKMPFPALWRTDFGNSLELIDSWEMLLQEKEGGDFLKPTWFGSGGRRVPKSRQQVDQAIGGHSYPTWSDVQGNGFVQPFNDKGPMELSFYGPLVIYPINRLPQTPLDAFTVVDVVRNTLGVGPCEYILDVEGQKSELKGRATCSVREELNDLYSKKEQKARQADIEQFLKQGTTFVTHIRTRINGYVDFGHAMQKSCAEQRKAHPETAAALAPLEKLLGEIDARVAARKDKIRTPEYAAGLFEEFRKSLAKDESPEALEKVKKWTDALVEVGGNQDELVGQCRYVVKNLRQKAGIVKAQEPKLAALCDEIRVKAQEVLRNPAVHESARH